MPTVADGGAAEASLTALPNMVTEDNATDDKWTMPDMADNAATHGKAEVEVTALPNMASRGTAMRKQQ